MILISMGATGENKDSMERIEIHREWSPLVIKQILANKRWSFVGVGLNVSEYTL